MINYFLVHKWYLKPTFLHFVDIAPVRVVLILRGWDLATLIADHLPCLEVVFPQVVSQVGKIGEMAIAGNTPWFMVRAVLDVFDEHLQLGVDKVTLTTIVNGPRFGHKSRFTFIIFWVHHCHFWSSNKNSVTWHILCFRFSITIFVGNTN